MLLETENWKGEVRSVRGRGVWESETQSSSGLQFMMTELKWGDKVRDEWEPRSGD